LNTISTLLAIIGGFNNKLLSFGRSLACVAMVLMVFCILLQIFFRYALNNALPWPEEAARALMIWMMAFVAPSAYRYAGFVAIEMVPDMMPKKYCYWLHWLLQSCFHMPGHIFQLLCCLIHLV
jgi:TRAP-type C4-dicarboxylate transport system permease small subunit